MSRESPGFRRRGDDTPGVFVGAKGKIGGRKEGRKEERKQESKKERKTG
jgi:hypothetical protein